MLLQLITVSRLGMKGDLTSGSMIFTQQSFVTSSSLPMIVLLVFVVIITSLPLNFSRNLHKQPQSLSSLQ